MEQRRTPVRATVLGAAALTIALLAGGATEASAKPAPPTDPDTPRTSAVVSDASVFVPVTPCRIVDTRHATAGAMAAYQTRTFQTTGTTGFTAQGGNTTGCGIPADATAISASITAVDPGTTGYLRVAPNGGPMPTATFLNFRTAVSITNTGTLPIATNGRLDARNYSARPTHLVIDVAGYFRSDAPGTGAVAISGGDTHTCALRQDASIVCWGSNFNGELGDGTETGSTTPVQVDGLAPASAVSAGGGHTCAVLVDTTVRCWGDNREGQLGNGTTDDSATPVTVSGLTGVVAVSAGNEHTCAALASGVLKCWGANDNGQLGDDSGSDHSTTPVTVTGLVGKSVFAVSASKFHTCAALTDGTARCWGFNGSGRLGNGTNVSSTTPVVVSGLTGVADITTGDAFSCALRTDGSVRCWGSNNDGQLGNGSYDNSKVPVSPSGITDATSITTGEFHTCVTRTNGSVRCWGSDSDGQLGNGAAGPSTTPVTVEGLTASTVSAGLLHTCALTPTGGAKCWGMNDNGQLGNGTEVSSNSPVSVVGIP
ncbi:MAG: hypothetical protein KDB02_10680 [Acidimicrobiales bacterium]|nr:hypothetical protein [Acidimicrobiales bacterium]